MKSILYGGEMNKLAHTPHLQLLLHALPSAWQHSLGICFAGVCPQTLHQWYYYHI